MVRCCRALAQDFTTMSDQLETARLKLRPCRMDDLHAVHRLWTNDHVRHFLFDNRRISLDEAGAFIEASLASFEQKAYGLWLVFTRDHEQLIGFAGFLSSAESAPSLIYGIHPDHCDKGYATEAASAVLSYALNRLRLPQISADVDEPNTLSVRVLEKLGLQRTGREVVMGRPLLTFEITQADSQRHLL
jgi:[ribosomal protein S5]-alanine N-acetyltransferase